MKTLLKISIFLFILMINNTSFASEYDSDLIELVNLDMKKWASDNVVINGLLESNVHSEELSESDFKIVNNKWQSEFRKNVRPLIDSLMSRPLSEYLKDIQDKGQGLYTEIIVIDKYGINAGQSRLSLNYWQGEENRWVKTMKEKSYAIYMSDLHYDDNTGLFQVDVSFLLMHEDEPIGVIYAGIDIEQLEEWKKRREQIEP